MNCETNGEMNKYNNDNYSNIYYRKLSHLLVIYREVLS